MAMPSHKQQKNEKLEAEVAAFFAEASAEREETKETQTAALRTFVRDRAKQVHDGKKKKSRV